MPQRRWIFDFVGKLLLWTLWEVNTTSHLWLKEVTYWKSQGRRMEIFLVRPYRNVATTRVKFSTNQRHHMITAATSMGRKCNFNKTLQEVTGRKSQKGCMDVHFVSFIIISLRHSDVEFLTYQGRHGSDVCGRWMRHPICYLKKSNFGSRMDVVWKLILLHSFPNVAPTLNFRSARDVTAERLCKVNMTSDLRLKEFSYG